MWPISYDFEVYFRLLLYQGNNCFRYYPDILRKASSLARYNLFNSVMSAKILDLFAASSYEDLNHAIFNHHNTQLNAVIIADVC